MRELGARLTAGLRTEDAPALDRWVRYVYYQPEVFRYLEVVGAGGCHPGHALVPRFVVTTRDLTEAALVAGQPGRTGHGSRCIRG